MGNRRLDGLAEILDAEVGHEHLRLNKIRIRWFRKKMKRMKTKKKEIAARRNSGKMDANIGALLARPENLLVSAG